MKSQLSKNLGHSNFFALIILGLALLWSPISNAENIDPTFLSITDGLASTTVNDIMQDSYGLLWLATANGLQKYDGISYETFKNDPKNPNSIINNETWGLVEDDDKNIWIACVDGLSKYNRINKTFTNYHLKTQFNLPEIDGALIHIFKDSDNRIWGVTQGYGLIYYDPTQDRLLNLFRSDKSFTRQNDLGYITLGFTKDKDDGIYMGAQNLGLFYKSKTDSTLQPIKFEADSVDFTQTNNTITSLYADSTNTIWITTRTGVYKFYHDKAILKTIKTYSSNFVINSTFFNSIKPDNEGNIWITNNQHGILKFDGISDNYTEIGINGSYFMKGLGWNLVITNFTIDKSGIYWFTTAGSGIIKYDPEKKPFLWYTHNSSNKNSVSDNSIFGLTASKYHPNLIYVGTRNNGLNILNQQTQKFAHVTYKVIDDTYGGAVRSIGESKNGNIWLGTWGDGLIKMDESYREITRYKYNTETENSIPADKVRVIRSDSHGNFWIGTVNGLAYFNVEKGEFKRYPSKQIKAYPQKIIKQVEALRNSPNKVAEIKDVPASQNLSISYSITEKGEYLLMMVGEGTATSMSDYGWLENENGDTIWSTNNIELSYYAGGATKNRMQIAALTLEPGLYKLRYTSDDSHNFGSWNLPEPTFSSLYGIALIKLSNPQLAQEIDQFLKLNYKAENLSGSDITDIVVKDNYVWVATGGNGLNRIDLINNTIEVWKNDPENENSLSNDLIYGLCEDKNGILWLTTSGGLNKFNATSGAFTHYTEKDGLPTDLTESVLEGDNGEMWISTDAGLSQMINSESLGKVTFINFNSGDGLGGDTFLAQVATRSADGRFYFGGDHGLNAIRSVSTNNTPPDLIFTNLLISNKSVFEMEKDAPIQTDLNTASHLELNYQENNLSFEFAALHYANPLKNQYAHFLEGYDKDWVYDNRNFASYTNLDPGEYTFSIRASNAYGIWNEEGKSIHIIISPPWWYTWWAYVIYAVAFIGIIVGFDRVMRRRVMLQERERTREKELAQAKEIEKAYTELKSTQTQLVQAEKMASLGELTAGIAHEIQNPLNFVNNFSEVSTELLAELKEEIVKGNYDEVKEIANDVTNNLEKILHHGKRADGIVKNMLLHSRGSSGHAEPTDINALADEYLRLSFHGLRARDKSFNADFKLNTVENLPKVNVVPQDMGRVLLNLINNAFYAVNEKNKQQNNGYKPMVTVSTSVANKQKQLEIIVSDNGNGIPEHVKEKIFQPFFTTKPSGQGTGLGLSLSYDIVKAHGGDLLLESKEKEGTKFIIQIPIKS